MGSLRLGRCFDGLSRLQQTAVAKFVSDEHSWLISVEPETYIVRHAKANSEHWQDGLRELIASDPKRVRAILETVQREATENSGGGFTLIELSIVLVIIGLIVGGVLLGQSLISAAAVRAQVTQIEKFNTAANTFFQKFGYLPGDIPDPAASSFGFQARGQYAGEGDGNGLLQGVYTDASGQNYGTRMAAGETAMFWADLTVAHLIDGSFTVASTHTPWPSQITNTSSPGINRYLPESKIGNGNTSIFGAAVLTPVRPLATSVIILDCRHPRSFPHLLPLLL